MTIRWDHERHPLGTARELLTSGVMRVCYALAAIHAAAAAVYSPWLLLAAALFPLMGVNAYYRARWFA